MQDIRQATSRHPADVQLADAQPESLDQLVDAPRRDPEHIGLLHDSEQRRLGPLVASRRRLPAPGRANTDRFEARTLAKLAATAWSRPARARRTRRRRCLRATAAALRRC